MTSILSLTAWIMLIIKIKQLEECVRETLEDDL